jgi:hypothetical protein
MFLGLSALLLCFFYSLYVYVYVYGLVATDRRRRLLCGMTWHVVSLITKLLRQLCRSMPIQRTCEVNGRWATKGSTLGSEQL